VYYFFKGVTTMSSIERDMVIALAEHQGILEKEAATRKLEIRRAGDLARMLIETVTDHSNAYLRSSSFVSETDRQKLPARVYSAVLLNLIGLRSSNFHHAETEAVCVDRPFDTVGLYFDNVAFKISSMGLSLPIRTIDDWTPTNIPEVVLNEGTIELVATKNTDGRPRKVKSYSAWIAQGEMPAGYTNKEEREGDAGYFGRLSQRMLAYVANEELNPQFFTQNFLMGVSKELAEKALDTELPLNAIDVNQYVPKWLIQGRK
jgi:hypothetical protein